MKCHGCGKRCEPVTCFPDRPGGGGWTYHYCHNKSCRFARLLVPQEPRRKPVCRMDVAEKQRAPAFRKPV